MFRHYPDFHTQDRELSLFDVINLAQCAVKRAEQSAGQLGGRFADEYWTAQMWASEAQEYRVCLPIR